jgi:hypothetical protein
VLLLSLCAASALAADVYVNGVNVEGLANQAFTNVNVRLDEKGNVLIDAPGYSVKRVTLQPDQKPEATISVRYFLVTEQAQVGLTQFDISLLINGEPYRTFKSDDGQQVVELTKGLKPGKNQLTLRAKKLVALDAQPRSTSRAHFFRVTIGEGTSDKEKVTLERPLVTFTRTAAERDDVTQDFSLTTR